MESTVPNPIFCMVCETIRQIAQESITNADTTPVTEEVTKSEPTTVTETTVTKKYVLQYTRDCFKNCSNILRSRYIPRLQLVELENSNFVGVKMKIKVQFFEERLVDAVGAGVYEIYAKTGNKEELFYVGESVFVLVRCATHLYEISKGKGYLGFDKEKIENDNITLIFKLYDNVSSKINRTTLEQKLIDTKKPKMQSGIKDRVKPIEDMIDELTNFLNE